MEVISGPRGSGKTTELIRVANENEATLVCHTKERCKHVYYSDMYPDLEIEPISYDELVGDSLRGEHKAVVLDDVDMFLRYTLEKNVVGFSVTSDKTIELTS